nr:XtrA/YqaO family protein [Enterococcus plantarum]
MARLDLKATELEHIKDLLGKNAIVIFSNGQVKCAELPEHGIVEITTHANKVTFVEKKVKEKF